MTLNGRYALRCIRRKDTSVLLGSYKLHIFDCQFCGTDKVPVKAKRDPKF